MPLCTPHSLDQKCSPIPFRENCVYASSTASPVWDAYPSMMKPVIEMSHSLKYVLQCSVQTSKPEGRPDHFLGSRRLPGFTYPAPQSAATELIVGGFLPPHVDHPWPEAV